MEQYKPITSEQVAHWRAQQPPPVKRWPQPVELPPAAQAEVEAIADPKQRLDRYRELQAAARAAKARAEAEAEAQEGH